MSDGLLSIINATIAYRNEGAAYDVRYTVFVRYAVTGVAYEGYETPDRTRRFDEP